MLCDPSLHLQLHRIRASRESRTVGLERDERSPDIELVVKDNHSEGLWQDIEARLSSEECANGAECLSVMRWSPCGAQAATGTSVQRRL